MLYINDNSIEAQQYFDGNFASNGIELTMDVIPVEHTNINTSTTTFR